MKTQRCIILLRHNLPPLLPSSESRNSINLNNNQMSNHKKITCVSSAHQNLVEKLMELQDRFTHLQSARKEGRINDHALLEAQISQNLREWQTELTAPSPATSLLGEENISHFSEEIARLMKLNDEEDDATSSLKEHNAPKPEDYTPQEALDWTTDQPFDFNFDEFQELGNFDITDYDLSEIRQEQEFTTPSSAIIPPPSAFLGPKCALWDCTRPAQGTDWFLDYCSSYHGTLALNEDSPGTAPVLRPGGISLKDNLLIDALRGKTQGKNVGIPYCEGAVNTKCPWNASELFHLELVEGETVREWLFFDKPRRAYDSGNRKQRSLPDYSGRGWHESRKQLMKELEGQNRSYYMDPQPSGMFEWHLFEYQINEFDGCALYRLELKLTSGKKSTTPKGKVLKDPLVDLQKKMEKMGQLTTAEVSGSENGSSVSKSRAKANKGVKTQETTITEPSSHQ